MMMNHFNHGMSGRGMVGMAAGPLLFWGLASASIVMVVRSAGGRDRNAGVFNVRPQQVLAERFARTGVDEEQYQRRPQILRRAPRGSGG